MKIDCTRLSNGLTILTDKMPDVRSATIGIWLRLGSRHEPTHANGILHFIEHAVFKGTKKRTALEIAIETDRLGGHLDAFTTHDTTGFVVRAADTGFKRAFDLLSDLVFNPRFDEKELRQERRVILEEIKMVEDSPEEFLGEIFMREYFSGNNLAFPIEGTVSTVKTFDQNLTSEFHRRYYTPKNVIVAAAGNVKHRELVNMLVEIFHSSPVRAENSDSKKKSGRRKNVDGKPPVPNPMIVLRNKRNFEQVHMILATPWISARDEKRYAAHLLENALGNGTSSQLWQSIREQRGLAYSVGASSNSFQDCGVFTIFAAMSPDNLKQVVDLSIAEMRSIKRDGITADQLQLAKDQTIASILLGLEDSSARASHLAHSEMIHGRQISLPETLEKLSKVTREDVKNIAREFFQTEKIALAALGNLSGVKISPNRLEI